MIKYSNNTINDWNFGASNLIKVYRNNAVCYYKISGEAPTPTYDLCYAVVDDISQYSDTEFDDVFNKADGKWYKLNNLNQYEEYGIYGSGRTICEGSTSRLPQGYTEVEYIENTSTAYINTEVLLYDSTTNSYEIETKMSSTWGGGELEYLLSTEGTSSPYNGLELRWNTHYQSGGELECESVPKNVTYSNIDNGDGTSAITISCTSTNTTNNVPLSLFCGIWSSGPWRNGKGKIYDLKITKNDVLVRDLVPCQRDSDGKYGLFDIVNNVFYLSSNNVNFSGGKPITPTDCVTTYEGKLTIDGDYEYQYSGGSWVNVGEVSGGSITIKSPEYIERTSSYNGYLSLQEYYTQDTKIIIKHRQTTGGGGSFIGDYFNNDDDDWRVFFANSNLFYDFISQRKSTSKSMPMSAAEEWEIGNYYIKNTATSTNILTGATQTFSSRPNQMYLYYLGNYGNVTDYGQVYYLKIYKDNVLVRDFIPWTDMNGNYGIYDKVENELIHSVGNMTGSSNVTDVEVGGTEYPIYYDEKSDPLDNLTFNTLEEAETYAYNNCVYDGMKATINGAKYVFDLTNGWEEVTEYYRFEDVTPNGASGWTISGSATYNPDSSYYDDYSLETDSFSNLYKIAKVTIYGYDHFTYYLRSSHPYGGGHAIVTASKIDELSTEPTTLPYNTYQAITNTYGKMTPQGASVDLYNYRRVTYNNLDKTVEHTFYVAFYGHSYPSASSKGNATILIPKEQKNENWEQVTFSVPTELPTNNRNLVIDSNAISGGTQYFYYRWMIGLPSGTHTSSIGNASYYDYCPIVSSSTFTSVEKGVRDVNYTYDGGTSKNLHFYLVDENSNTLTPTDSVYYSLTRCNTCGVCTTSNNQIFPSFSSVKVGGSFSLGNSSNKHYIYGYQPPTLGITYNVNDYGSAFNIVYTKLNTEAVTITYTTYDPSDTEVPAFNTKIIYPYNGGTTSATTLTSFNVPYTYPYEVSQTNNMFSADTQSYTANQAARTISFTLYPNNREFASVSDLESYAYAWEGMRATVGDTVYIYDNGAWVVSPIPLAYTELEYFTVPKVRTSTLFTIKNEMQPDYVYTYSFTPNSGFYDGYYGMVTTQDGDSNFYKYGIFKLDNGWGVENRRNVLSCYNYKFDTRNNGNAPGAFRYYVGSKATVIMKLHNPLDSTEGVDLTVENVGYTTVNLTSTTLMESSKTITNGVYDMSLFTSNPYNNNCYSPQINFHIFKVEDTNGNLIYDYRPVIRMSDNKVGLYDIVNQQFFYPTTITLVAGPQK